MPLRRSTAASGLPLALGLLGFPLGHTLSPGLHQAFLKEAGLNGFYNVLETPPTTLPTTVEQLKTQGYRGWNVTIPHKTAMLQLVDDLSEEAEAMGAVNTVVHCPDTGFLKGHNTDATGFWQSLSSQHQTRARQGACLVLGAGGASKAIVWTLLKQGCPQVVVAARKLEQAQKQFQAMAAQHANLAFIALNDDALQQLDWAAFTLLVNCTPVGMWPETQATPLASIYLKRLPSFCGVVDLIYKPAETRLLQEASAFGLSVQDGYDMLVYQAAFAFRLWTGVEMTTAFLESIIGKRV